MNTMNELNEKFF